LLDHAFCLVDTFLKGFRLKQGSIININTLGSGQRSYPPLLPSGSVWRYGCIRVGISDIDGNEGYLIGALGAINTIQGFGGSDPLPIGTSGVGSKNQHYRFGGTELGKFILGQGLGSIASGQGLRGVYAHQGEVDSRIVDFGS
jgi:hypothetical protein